MRFITIILHFIFYHSIISLYEQPNAGQIQKVLNLRIKDHYIILLKPPAANITNKSSLMEANTNVLNNHFDQVNQLIQTRMSNTSKSFGVEDIRKQIRHHYQSDYFLGYSAQFDTEMIDAIKTLEDVDSIEKDQIMTTLKLNQQSSPPWGLARLSTRLNRLGESSYIFDSSSGAGVNCYIIDTGINLAHKTFEGRASWGASFGDNLPDEDDNGHGTHVAGTVGSSKYGVAKAANLIAVKVLNGEGSGATSDIIKGIEWVIEHAKKSGKPSVANMSLGGSYSKATNRAVEAAVRSGIAFAVAAGNENSDACEFSPASSEYALSVGATEKHDSKASFSNWGPCVSVFAPGQDILSTWIGSSSKTNTISGTSMASPHICGLMAYFMGISKRKMSPQEIYFMVVNAATPSLVKGLDRSTANLLAYNLAGDL